jgi:hypothetical protein
MKDGRIYRLNRFVVSYIAMASVASYGFLSDSEYEGRVVVREVSVWHGYPPHRPGQALYRDPELMLTCNICVRPSTALEVINMSSAPMPELPRTNEGKRICQVIKVKPEALEEYKKVRELLNRSSTLRLVLTNRTVPRSSLARSP